MLRARDLAFFPAGRAKVLKDLGIAVPKIKKPRNRKEEGLQAACLKWFRFQYPKMYKYWIHIPNGAALASFKDKQGRRISPEAIRMKKLGLRKGASDLFFAMPRLSVGRAGLWIEMKFKSEGTVSPEQNEFLHDMAAVGFHGAVCRTIEDFQRSVNLYLSN